MFISVCRFVCLRAIIQKSCKSIFVKKIWSRKPLNNNEFSGGNPRIVLCLSALHEVTVLYYRSLGVSTEISNNNLSDEPNFNIVHQFSTAKCPRCRFKVNSVGALLCCLWRLYVSSICGTTANLLTKVDRNRFNGDASVSFHHWSCHFFDPSITFCPKLQNQIN